jgi:hypothetical protein
MFTRPKKTGRSGKWVSMFKLICSLMTEIVAGKYVVFKKEQKGQQNNGCLPKATSSIKGLRLESCHETITAGGFSS